jgi:hypothetical protein
MGRIFDTYEMTIIVFAAAWLLLNMLVETNSAWQVFRDARASGARPRLLSSMADKAPFITLCAVWAVINAATIWLSATFVLGQGGYLLDLGMEAVLGLLVKASHLVGIASDDVVQYAGFLLLGIAVPLMVILRAIIRHIADRRVPIRWRAKLAHDRHQGESPGLRSADTEAESDR